jgi:hypothetical protein
MRLEFAAVVLLIAVVSAASAQRVRTYTIEDAVAIAQAQNPGDPGGRTDRQPRHGQFRTRL